MRRKAVLFCPTSEMGLSLHSSIPRCRSLHGTNRPKSMQTTNTHKIVYQQSYRDLQICTPSLYFSMDWLHTLMPSDTQLLLQPSLGLLSDSTLCPVSSYTKLPATRTNLLCHSFAIEFRPKTPCRDPNVAGPQTKTPACKERSRPRWQVRRLYFDQFWPNAEGTHCLQQMTAPFTTGIV